MTWAEYRIAYHSDKAQQHDFHRYVRAVSRRDAEWRAAHKFILPSDAVITNIERIKQA